MTPQERSAYDSYAQYMSIVTRSVEAVTGAPLDELLAANTRMTLAGIIIQPGTGKTHFLTDRDRAGLDVQRQLLEAAVAFRAAVTAPVELSTAPSAPPPALHVPGRP